MNATTGQTQATRDFLKENVLRALEMYNNVEETFAHEKVGDLAQQIFADGLEIIRGEVRNQPIEVQDLTPVVVELNKVSPSANIQSDALILTSVLKAHRIMTEITWVQCWKQGHQPIYTENRDAIFATVNKVKTLLPLITKMENGVFTTTAMARYEAACLEQAAKCLSPTEGVFGELLQPAATAIAGAIKLSVGDIFKGLAQVAAVREIT